MTHEQLLQTIRNEFFFTQGLGTVLHMNSCSSSPCNCSAIDETHQKLRNTMLAIVELHKPYGDVQCSICENGQWPCSTIKTISEALA